MVWSIRPLLLPILSICLFILDGTAAIPTSYANGFVDPRWLLAKNWNANSTAAQGAIISGTDDLALQSPWSVINKTILAPTNNTHDYLSFAPYYWPDCSNVHNKTQLTQWQVWNLCKYGTFYSIYSEHVDCPCAKTHVFVFVASPPASYSDI